MGTTILLPLAFIGGIGMPEMIILGIVGVLLFGRNLPEVGRSLGKSFIEFKRGISGIENELNTAVNRPATRSTSSAKKSTFNDIDDRDEATAPKFEPPKAEPQAASRDS